MIAMDEFELEATEPVLMGWVSHQHHGDGTAAGTDRRERSPEAFVPCTAAGRWLADGF